jgi:hypothetical protein
LVGIHLVELIAWRLAFVIVSVVQSNQRCLLKDKTHILDKTRETSRWNNRSFHAYRKSTYKSLQHEHRLR